MKAFFLFGTLLLLATTLVFKAESASLKQLAKEAKTKTVEGMENILAVIEKAVAEEKEKIKGYKMDNQGSEGTEPYKSEALEEIAVFLEESGIDDAKVNAELGELEKAKTGEALNDLEVEEVMGLKGILLPNQDNLEDDLPELEKEFKSFVSDVVPSKDSLKGNLPELETEEVMGLVGDEVPSKGNLKGDLPELETEEVMGLVGEVPSKDNLKGDLPELETEEVVGLVGEEVPSMKSSESEFEVQAEKPLSRKRRFLVWNKSWPKSIVPYFLNETALPSGWAYDIRRAMATYERFTCLKFKPYREVNETQTVNEKMNLGHSGYLNFINSASCWSHVGCNKNKQDISCCRGKTCLHELGHAMGAYHEHQNPLGKPFIHINTQNIKPDFKDSYKYTSGFSEGYDMQSVMHYNRWTWSKSGRTMDYRMSNVKGTTERDYFYLMREISLNQKCQEQYCSDSTIKCENDGYLIPIDGTCQCRCPKGLDPTTGCKTVLKRGSSPQQRKKRSAEYDYDNQDYDNVNLDARDSCVDEEDAFCQEFATPDICFDELFGEMTQVYCPKTCGICFDADTTTTTTTPTTTTTTTTPTTTTTTTPTTTTTTTPTTTTTTTTPTTTSTTPTTTTTTTTPTTTTTTTTPTTTTTTPTTTTTTTTPTTTTTTTPTTTTTTTTTTTPTTTTTAANNEGHNVWYQNRTWPKGAYALPNVKEGCPSEKGHFQLGSRKLAIVPSGCKDVSPTWHCSYWNNTRSTSCTVNYGYMGKQCANYCGHCKEENLVSWYGYNLEGAVKKNKLNVSYCVQDGSQTTAGGLTSEQYNNMVWPSGVYCIVRKGGSCPDQFSPGSVKYTLDSARTSEKSGADIDGEFNENITTEHFCCRSDGWTSDEMILPAGEPFALYRNSGSCQQVMGMKVTSEFKIIITNDDKFEGSVPIERYFPQRDEWKLHHCYYEPADLESCGGDVKLTDENPEKIISYSATGGNKECNWLVQGPSGSRIVMNFNEFNIAKWTTACKDTMDIRYDHLGQTPQSYCGTSIKPITSYHDTLMMTLETGSENTTSSFKVSLRLLSRTNSCYNMTDRGFTYNGKHNVTIGNKACIPWHQATNCPHHAFNKDDIGANLEGNYCRNPGKTGLSPWCYVDGSSCLSDVCDVCNVEAAYDSKSTGCNATDCNGSLTNRLECAKTCGGDQANQHVAPKKCTKPQSGNDADPQGALKEEYRAGETVAYKCKTSDKTEIRYCLSSGEWSFLPGICETCRSDWTHTNNVCMAFLPDDGKGNMDHANWVCDKYNASLPVIKSAAKNQAVKTVSRGYEVWLGANDTATEGTWKWIDGSNVTGGYTDWMRGQPNNYRGREDCATVKSSWRDVSCSSKFRVTCEHNAWGASVCSDKLGQCEELKAVGNSLTTHKSFMEENCKKTLGKC